MGAERKVVTVLFVDLVGFTSLAEQLDPEDVSRLLTPYYGRVRTELERFGGTVEKFVGDAILGVFGAPLSHEDDAERALRAAFASRRAVEEINESERGQALGVRIGVTTGEVLLDLNADPARGETSVAGDVVNTAARLQQQARPGAIVVGAATRRATAHAVEYQTLESVVAKGKRLPVDAWEALTLVPAPERELRSRSETPVFGREHDLAYLRSTLERARTERALQVVTLMGEPGVGKSRLLVELQRAATAAGDQLVWRQGRCLPYGAGLTFWAFAEIVKAQAGILETDRAGAASERLQAAVAAVVPDPSEAEWVERHLRPLVGLEGKAGDRRESFAAWRRFVEGMAGASGLLVLAVEDLQWADDGLLDLLEHLVEWGGESAVALFCTARPEFLEQRPAWPGVRRVESLSPEATVELLGVLLTGTPVPGEVWSRLLSQTGGIPLYAKEYARMLTEGAPEGELPLPESVQALIAARLDVLGRDAKAVLQDAAVVGKEFWVSPLEELVGLPRETVEQRLSELERKGFVSGHEHSAVAGELQYAFSHVLIRDIAYGQIPRSRRTEKHRLVGDWVAALAPDRASNLAEMTAHHYASALEYARLSGQPSDELGRHARAALQAAGEHASQLNAFGSAERFYADALAILPAGDVDEALLRFQLGTARFRAEGGGSEDLEQARELLLAAADVDRAAEADVLLAELRFRQGDVDGAFAQLETAAALLEDAPPSRQKALVLSSLSRFRAAEYESLEAIQLGEEALAMAEQLELDEIRAHALNNIGLARVTLGDAGGVGDLERSVEISVAVGSVEAVRGYLNLGTTLAHLGDLDRAFAVHADGRRLAKRLGDATGIRWFAVERLFECYWTGWWDEAAADAEALLDAIDAPADYYTELGARQVRGWVRLGRGDLEGALEDAARYVDLGREVRYPQALYPALALAARANGAAGETSAARDLARELLVSWGKSTVETAAFWTADLAFALVELGRGGELVDVARRVEAPTPWLEAACAFASGDAATAADRYSSIGSRPDEAFARLRAGGRNGDDFVRRVGAAGYAAVSPP
jgi:class 3 adenylate cyclase/tetratricopeptide (TPR) repeat protein